MSVATLDDTGTPTIEVRVYDHDRLLTRELCESEAGAAVVVDRWSDVASLFVVADDLPARHVPRGTFASGDRPGDDGEPQPLACTPLPGYGTE